MRPETIHLMCNPYQGEPLIRKGNQLIGTASQQSFQIKHGIPVILAEPSLLGRNQFSKLIYDLSARLYDPIICLGDAIGLNTEGRVRRDHIAHMEFIPNARVLETAVGTAANLPYLPKDIELYGLDISFPMLKRAQRKARKLNRDIELVQADCGYIPFFDESFDAVFQMGGLQFTSAPFKAVSEMARVAKPGANVQIIDEIRSAINLFSKMPAHRKYATPDKIIAGIKRLVPHSMVNIHSEQISNTQFYLLRFQRPAIPVKGSQ